MLKNSIRRAITWMLIALLPASLARADVITVGSQAGAQIFFNNTLTRTYNFGVTQTGAGLSVTQLDVNVKGGNAGVTVSPVIVSVYSGLGGTGSVLASGTIAANALTGQFQFISVPFSTLTLGAGGYSVVLSTTNTDNYYIKAGTTKLTTNGTTAVTSSLWVEDTNVDGNAGTTLNAASPVLATWTLGTNAYRFGNYRVGTTLSATTPIVNTALVTSNTMTQALAATGTTTGGVNSLTGLPSPYLSVGGTSNVVTGLNGATTGPNSGTATLTFNSVPGTSNTTGTTAVGSGTITITGTGYNWATAAYSGSAFAFGYIHRGGAAASGTVTIGNQTVVNASYQDSLDVSATTGNPLVSASGFTGLAASAGGATRNNLVVAVGTGTAGSLNSTLALSLVSNANGVAGLSNGVASVIGSPGSITTSGTVFTGQSTWNTNGGGEWGTLASNFGTNWNWTTFDGSPGVDAGFTNTDTATFGGAVTSGTATVTVTAATPSIRALTFDNASASYGLAGASGGALALLNAGTAAASVTTTAGTHGISLPVSLGSDTSWSVAAGARLGVSGIVSGLNDVTKVGPGTLVFSGNNTYAGTTTVTAGTLVVNGDQAAATGAMTVAAGATLAGSGVIGGDTTVAGIHTPGNSPGIQTVDGNLTYEAGSTVVWELINDTVLGRGTNYDGINVTGTLSFSGSTSLDLVFNLAGSGVSWSDSFWDSNHTETNGWLVYQGAASLANFENLAINGTDWADGTGAMFQTARPGAAFGLYQDGSDVYLTYAVAVPEPSTLILAGLGLAAAAIIRRRRRS